MKYDQTINIVSGGAGFLGSNLIKKLISKGEFVYCIDNLSSGYILNIKDYINNKRFNFINHDIRKSLALYSDKIWHFASPASPSYYLKHPIETIETGFNGTTNLVKLAIKNNSTFLFPSSSEIYGDPLVNPQIESYYGNLNSFGSRSCYAESKRIGETICYEYFKNFGLKLRLARIFNTYGPNTSINDGRVISKFIYQSLKKQKLSIFGTGEQTRSFCYVDDLIDGLLSLMNSDYSKPINLGNPNEISIKKLSEKIISMVNPRLEKEFLIEMIDDPKQRRPSIEIANKVLNWNPKISLDSGLKKTIEYFKKNI